MALAISAVSACIIIQSDVLGVQNVNDAQAVAACAANLIPIVIVNGMGIAIQCRSISLRTQAGRGAASGTRVNRMMVILENMDGVMAATVDVLGKFIYVTASSKGMCGYAPADMVGQFVLTFVHPDDVNKVGELVQAVRVGRGDHHERAGRVVGEEVIELVRFQMRRKEGSFVWMEVKHTRSMQEEKPVHVMIFQVHYALCTMHYARCTMHYALYSYSACYDIPGDQRGGPG
jgi:PAS domain S-box-containing protein